MKKEVKISIAVLLGFLAFLWLEKPTRELLVHYQVDELIAKLISGLLIRLVLIVGTIVLVIKLKLIEFVSLNALGKFRNIHSAMIALSIIIMGFISNWNTYISTQLYMVIMFLLYALTVGIVEEFVFRGTIFPLFIRGFKNEKWPIILSAVVSSFLFGVIHYVNLFKQPENIIGITSQVFFALSIGVFFCGLMVRTENIVIPCLIHGLINFTFGSGELKQISEDTSIIAESSGTDWSTLIPTTIFFTFIFLGGVYMILKSNKELILHKLEDG